MKTIIVSFLILAVSASSFAGTSTFECSMDSNPNRAALVAGEKFQITTNSDFGYNAYYQHNVVVQSEYLGTCDGVGTENMNPIAEGFSGAASVTGSECAADGFDIYMSPGLRGIIQVGSGEEAVFYNCSEK